MQAIFDGLQLLQSDYKVVIMFVIAQYKSAISKSMTGVRFINTDGSKDYTFADLKGSKSHLKLANKIEACYIAFVSIIGGILIPGD